MTDHLVPPFTVRMHCNADDAVVYPWRRKIRASLIITPAGIIYRKV